MGLWQKYLDFWEPIEKYGSSLNWVSPAVNELQGFATLVFSGSYEGAVAHKLGLEKRRIPCRLEGTGPDTACVYTR